MEKQVFERLNPDGTSTFLSGLSELHIGDRFRGTFDCPDLIFRVDSEPTPSHPADAGMDQPEYQITAMAEDSAAFAYFLNARAATASLAARLAGSEAAAAAPPE